MEQDRDWLLAAAAIAVLAAIIAALLKLVTGYPGQPNGMAGLEATIILVTLAAFTRFMKYFYGLWREGEPHPMTRLRGAAGPAIRGFGAVAAGIPILGLFLYSMTFLKSIIPAVVPFWSDGIFAAVDRSFFIDPQKMAVAMHPALPALGLFYGLWHAVHLVSILWVLHWRKGNKGRHVLSFMLTWSIGMALAYIFSSAGPLFTGVYNPNVAPDSVRMAAKFLWNNYQTERGLIGGGISAFPSMHVAMAAWFAIVLRDRGWTKAGLAYLSAIYLCSIVLG